MTTAVRMLVLFHRVLSDDVGQALGAYLEDQSHVRYAAVVRALWTSGLSLRAHLIERVVHDENPFTLAAEAGAVTGPMLQAACEDLRHLSTLAALRFNAEGLPPEPAVAAPGAGIKAKLAAAHDWAPLARDLADHIQAIGAGPMGRYHGFAWSSGQLKGIDHPDPIRLDQLVGHEEAKQTVLGNTEQFLRGLPANNLLLYGDRGTGKSSTVKALLHRYGPQGLRLVEVSRSDLKDVGSVMQRLRGRKQWFILFIDDLSFEEFEAEYKTFKAVMEGSLERRPDNVLVYATTNRKHLIKERWSDRPSPADDEVHAGDTMEEKLSLADRFGLTVVFTTPDQEQYLAIVRELAAQRSIDLPWDELRRRALQWELWQNGRSGRTARQFIDDLSGKLSAK